MARRVVVAFLAVAALALGVTTWLMAQRQASDDAKALRAVLRADAANEDQADSAAKQQVVNGWTARDLLALQSRQQADQHRLVGLVGVVVGLAGAAIGVGLLLLPGRRAAPVRDIAPFAPPAPPPPPPPRPDLAPDDRHPGEPVRRTSELRTFRRLERGAGRGLPAEDR